MNTPRRIAVICFTLFLFGCQMGDSKIERFLAEYEDFVVTYEKKANSASPVTSNDTTEMYKQGMELISKMEDLRKTEKWSASDIQKYAVLGRRFHEAQKKLYTRERTYIDSSDSKKSERK